MRFAPTLIASALAALAPLAAQATNGYFSHGYGVKALGLAGAGIALPRDALAAATNPAGTAAVGERADLGLSWFSPSRSATLVSADASSHTDFSGNGRKSFYISVPAPATQTFFNILAPGVVQDHLSAGFTWRTAGGEWSGYAAQALGHSVNGSGSIPPSFGGGNANVRLQETLLGVSYGWRF